MSQANPTSVQVTNYSAHYVKYGDQSKAWRAAFPESSAGVKTVAEKASKLHKKTIIQARISELQQIATQQLAEEFNISVADIRKMLVGAASKGLKDHKGKPVSISGAVGALAELNRMNGNHAPTKIAGDAANPIHVVGMSADEYKAMRNKIIQEDDC